jgi:F-type H+-transporting ATPase subunit delta
MDSLIRVRYAKAFFQAAKEKKLLGELKSDIENILSICTNSPEFIGLLNSPVVKTKQKTDLISRIFKSQVNDLTLRFLILITENKREAEIPGICRNFLEMTRKDQNIKSATLITADEISSETTEKIRKIVEKETGAGIELTSRVNPDLIGGLILRIDDKQYDSSVATQLKKIRQQLLEQN